MILEPSEATSGAHGDHWTHEPVAGVPSSHRSQISPDERARRFGHKPVTVLLYGLPASGKATIAFALEKKLWDMGRAVKVLYGPDMRQGLCRDLGFSADDRSENLRRAAEVAKMMNDAGLIAICSFVAPHEEVRQKARRAIGADRFLEVYLSCPVEVCRQRDKSGAYAKADAGLIANFPGVTATYEEPQGADLVLKTDQISVDEAVQRIVEMLG
jgi:bifunctional enzyme CysN/CysC